MFCCLTPKLAGVVRTGDRVNIQDNEKQLSLSLRTVFSVRF